MNHLEGDLVKMQILLQDQMENAEVIGISDNLQVLPELLVCGSKMDFRTKRREIFTLFKGTLDISEYFKSIDIYCAENIL